MRPETDYNLQIVVLAKDEEPTISAVLDKILINFSAERILVIVAKNMSDRTAEIAGEKNIRVAFDSGKGKGSAIKTAIRESPADILLFIDADGSHAAEDIPRLIEPIKDGRADMVVGSRMLGGSEELSGSIANTVRRIGNLTSNFVINLLWGRRKEKITDCQNGFRAIRSSVAKELNLQEDSFAVEQEMVIKCLKRGYRVSEVATYEFKRKYGKSHINLAGMLTKCIFCFIKNIF